MLDYVFAYQRSQNTSANKVSTHRRTSRLDPVRKSQKSDCRTHHTPNLIAASQSHLSCDLAS
jgi:hypothetical protein